VTLQRLKPRIDGVDRLANLPPHGVPRVVDGRAQNVALIFGEDVPRVDHRRDALVDRLPDGGPVELLLLLLADLGFTASKLDLSALSLGFELPLIAPKLF
jgi:hypothetical protein